MESNEILTMRAMSWRRAKGELEAYLETYWSEYAKDGYKYENGFEVASEKISAFIMDFEVNCR